MKIWNQTNTVEQALELPTGSYCANFGFLVEQSVKPEHVLEAATAIKESGLEITVASQAGLIVKAKENELAFESWAELKLV